METKLIQAETTSDLVPSPAQYAVLLPERAAAEPLPLLLFLHGGGGSRDFLALMRPVIEGCWDDGSLPPMVVATPSVGRSFYMDYRDGSQRWESFILGPFMDLVRHDYSAASQRDRTFACGVSMGGMGVLRLGLKHPERFAAVAALEPGIDPALKWADVQPRHKFYRGPALFAELFGSPFDEAYWEQNNPANIAFANAEAIRGSGFQVWLDAGDEDFFNLHEGTEFLHRIFWEQRIPHDYHLIRGANHVGRTMPGRFREALAFLGRVIDPPGPDPAVEGLEARMGDAKRRFG
ncbi:MAG TPA: alpha/beta hydrolase-fold protein [Dehalococcoidia bacterium]